MSPVQDYEKLPTVMLFHLTVAGYWLKFSTSNNRNSVLTSLFTILPLRKADWTTVSYGLINFLLTKLASTLLYINCDIKSRNRANFVSENQL